MVAKFQEFSKLKTFYGNILEYVGINANKLEN